MRRSIAAAVTAMALLAIVVAPVGAASPNAQAKAKAEHARVVKYWTSERVKNAKPRDFIQRADGSFSAAPAPKAPKAKPPSGGSGAVTGASWTKGTDIVKKTGKVVFTMGRYDYVCSGSAVTDSRSGASLVLTAGHCAYDETTEAFATNWMYIPSFDTSPTYTCADASFGCWTAQALVVHEGYASAGGFNTQATAHDFAIAVVGPGGKPGQSVQLESLGTSSIAFPAISTGNKVHAFGYPASGKYKGKDLTYCAGNTFDDSRNEDLTWGLACNMTGGSSGGGWFGSFNESTGVGTLTSLNSYGYGGKAQMYGPKFDANTQAVVAAANSRNTTSNTIVD
jgi:hypothetical protein